MDEFRKLEMDELKELEMDELEMLCKYGVTVSDSMLNEELLRMGIEDGREAASKLEQTQARFNIAQRRK